MNLVLAEIFLSHDPLRSFQEYDVKIPRNTGEHNVHPAHIQHVVVGQALSEGASWL